nr:hypothetical protein [Sicyoidochytrium minutum DNA virus]
MGSRFSTGKSRETKRKERLDAMERKWEVAYSAFDEQRFSQLMHVSNLTGPGRGTKNSDRLLAAIEKQKQDGHGFVMYLDGIVRVNDYRSIMVEQENATAAFFDVPSERRTFALDALFKALGWYSLGESVPSNHYPLVSYLFYRAIPASDANHYLFIFHEGGIPVNEEALMAVRKSMRGAPQLSIIFANTKTT